MASVAGLGWHYQRHWPQFHCRKGAEPAQRTGTVIQDSQSNEDVSLASHVGKREYAVPVRWPGSASLRIDLLVACKDYHMTDADLKEPKEPQFLQTSNNTRYR